MWTEKSGDIHVCGDAYGDVCDQNDDDHGDVCVDVLELNICIFAHSQGAVYKNTREEVIIRC